MPDDPETILHIVNLDKMLDTLNKRAPQELAKATVDWMNSVIAKVVGWARHNAPVDTGQLQRTLAGQVKGVGGNVEGIAGSPLNYAPYVERKGNVRRKGRRPFLEPAVKEHETEIVREFEHGAESLWKRLGF